MSHQPGSMTVPRRVPCLRRAMAATVTAALLASMVVGARPAAATSHLTISIADSSVVEGDSGTVQLSFTVSIDQDEAPVQDDIEFEWETEDGTAVAPGDYTAVTAGVGTIQSMMSNPPNGEMETTITVDVSGDPDVEPDETFTVRLTAVTAGNATINGDEAVGTITDDDDLPVIWIEDASADEGDDGDEPSMAFTVRLSEPSADDITLEYDTADGGSDPLLHAQDDFFDFNEDHDFTAVDSEPFVVSAGATEVDVSVTLVGDDRHENDETFTVQLGADPEADNPDFRWPHDGDPDRSAEAVGTIRNDDPVPTVRIEDRTFPERESGIVAQRNVEISLTNRSSHDITVRYTTRDGTATVADGDYAAADETITFEGHLLEDDEFPIEHVVQIETYGDDEPEPNEVFYVDLSFDDVPEPVIGQFADDGSAVSVMTIVNDDGPRLSIDDVEVDEGNAGTTDVEFTVTVVEPGEDAISVDWTTVDDSAVAGTDYQAASGTLEIAAGETAGTITVKVVGDTTEEPDRAFRVRLSDPVGATLDDDEGQALIRDDDAGRPTASIADPPDAVEGSSVTFDGSGSVDPDGEIVSYTWDLGDGSELVTGSSPTVTHTFADDGTYTAKLTVTDDDDLAASTTRTVTVANAAPIVAAGPDTTVKVRRPVTLQATASDPGDDELTYSWDLGDGSDPVTGAEVTHTYTDVGEHTVTVTVSDGDGGEDSDTLVVDVTPDVGIVDRLSGDNRITTSLEVSRAGWPSSDDGAQASRDVVLATAWNYPDALAGGTLAALLGAPILLTDSDQLPAEVATELDRLGSTRVWILGGEAAIGPAVADEAAGDGRQVFRLEGSDRFETAAAVTRATGASRAGEVVIALGAHEVADRAWPDAVSAGALSSAPDAPPVLLTLPDALPASTEQALVDIEAQTVYVVGGEGAIAPTVADRLTQLGYEVVRLAGPDRYATSLAVAELALSRHEADSDRELVFATGAAFPDGLTATALAARLTAIVVLVPHGEVSETTDTFLADGADRFDQGVVVGGAAVVSEAVRERLATAITRD